MDVEGKWSKEVQGTKTIFASQMEYRQHSIPIENNNVPDLSYTIIDVNVPFLYEVCKQSLDIFEKQWLANRCFSFLNQPVRFRFHKKASFFIRHCFGEYCVGAVLLCRS